MPMVKAMTIIVDNLLPRPKFDYDVGYNAAMKDTSVVVLLKSKVLYSYASASPSQHATASTTSALVSPFQN